MGGRWRRGSSALSLDRWYDRGFTPVVLAVIALAIALRLVAYFSDWSLFIDDARLGIDIGWPRRPIIGQLPFEQFAPVAFLASERLVAGLAGINEYALRAIPLLAGIALLPTSWIVGRRLIGARAALLALVLLAASTVLLHYSSYSVKPYGLDALTTVVLLAATIPLLHGPASAQRAWWVLIGIGLLALCASTTAILVLAGVGTSLLIRHGPRWQLWLAAVLWLALFGAVYALSSPRGATSTYLYWFWQGGFLHVGATGWKWHAARAFLETWSGVSPVPASLAPRSLALLYVCVFVGGLVAIWQEMGSATAALLGTPYLVLLLASLAGRFPLATRVNLFAVPLLAFIAGAAGVALVRRLRESWRRVGFFTLLSTLAGLAVLDLAMWFTHTQPDDEPTRDLVGIVESSSPTEPVYLYAAAVPAWTFYTINWHDPDTAHLRWLATVTGVDGPAFENTGTRVRPLRDVGDSLRYRERGRTIIVGLGSGAAYDYYSYAPHPTADSGWATNEMRRLRNAARPAGWLFAAHYGSSPTLTGTEIADLVAAARAMGGVVTCAIVRPRSSLIRIDFASTASPADPPQCRGGG